MIFFLVSLVQSARAENPAGTLLQIIGRSTTPELPPLQLGRLLADLLPRYYCIQTYRDESWSSGSTLRQLMDRPECGPLVQGISWSPDGGGICKGYLLIGELFQSLRGILKRLPKRNGDRILILVREPLDSLIKTVSPGELGEAEMALVSWTDLREGQLFRQPSRALRRYRQPMSWPRSSDRRVKNLNGRPIRAVTYNCTVFSEVGPIDRNGTPAWSRGVEMELFTELASRHNLRPLVVAVERPNGTWHFWEELVGRRADLAFCGLFFTPNKYNREEVSLSVPLSTLCLKLLVPRPERLSFGLTGVFQPFEPTVWLVLGLALLSGSLLLHRLSLAALPRHTKSRRYKKLGSSFLQMLSILTLSDMPKSTSDQGAVRHLLTWWSLFSSLLAAVYSCSLVSHLTTLDFAPPPDSISRLLRGKYSWAAARRPDFNELLDTSIEAEAAWKNRFRLVSSPVEHAALNRADPKQVLWGFAKYRAFTLADYDLPDSLLDRYQDMPGCFRRHLTGFAIRKGSPFETAINAFIQSYTEAGLIQPLFRKVNMERFREHKYIFRVLHRNGGELSEPQRLKLQHLLGIIPVWFLGMGGAFLVFLLELAQRLKI